MYIIHVIDNPKPSNNHLYSLHTSPFSYAGLKMLLGKVKEIKGVWKQPWQREEERAEGGNEILTVIPFRCFRCSAKIFVYIFVSVSIAIYLKTMLKVENKQDKQKEPVNFFWWSDSTFVFYKQNAIWSMFCIL